jgi:hypothetical protein
VRDHIRKLSIAAFRDHRLSFKDISKLVTEVLEGAVESIDKSIPASRRNVLREVFDGLSEGVHTIASAGNRAIDEVRKGQVVASKNIKVVAKRVRDANADLLKAVGNFARKTSRDVRTELDTLVAGAERTAPKIVKAGRKAVKATDGRMMELGSETARAGVRVVRRSVAGIAMGAGGLMEGLAEVVAPRRQPAASRKSKSTRTSTPRAKTAKTSSKKKSPRRRLP